MANGPNIFQMLLVLKMITIILHINPSVKLIRDGFICSSLQSHVITVKNTPCSKK